MFIDDLNHAIQKEVFAMLNLKEEYDKQVSGGKLRFYDREYFSLDGLSIRAAIDELDSLQRQLSDYELDAISEVCDEDGCGSYIEYYWYETDDEYNARIEKLANNLAEKRVALELAERTRDFYLKN